MKRTSDSWFLFVEPKTMQLTVGGPWTACKACAGYCAECRIWRRVNMLVHFFLFLSWSSDSCFRFVRCNSDSMLSIPIWFGSSKVAAILVATRLFCFLWYWYAWYSKTKSDSWFSLEWTFSFLIVFEANICRKKTIYRSIFALGQKCTRHTHTTIYGWCVMCWIGVSGVGTSCKLTGCWRVEAWMGSSSSSSLCVSYIQNYIQNFRLPPLICVSRLNRDKVTGTWNATCQTSFFKVYTCLSTI